MAAEPASGLRCRADVFLDRILLAHDSHAYLVGSFFSFTWQSTLRSGLGFAALCGHEQEK